MQVCPKLPEHFNASGVDIVCGAQAKQNVAQALAAGSTVRHVAFQHGCGNVGNCRIHSHGQYMRRKRRQGMNAAVAQRAVGMQPDLDHARSGAAVQVAHQRQEEARKYAPVQIGYRHQGDCKRQQRDDAVNPGEPIKPHEYCEVEQADDGYDDDCSQHRARQVVEQRRCPQQAGDDASTCEQRRPAAPGANIKIQRRA